MKIIAFYLPQFHETKENNEWWGQGFTEWVNVEKAVPLFEGHRQPRVPLDDNYYDLTDDSIKEWQISLAKKYGIYGFCMYHYWFNGHLLLEKPVEQYLNNKSLDFPFCLCWANENWTTQWVDSHSRILIEQKYGNKEDWIKHFAYFLPFFKDSRYIKENNKPLLVIYRPDIIDGLNEMLECWENMAIENGFDGIVYANQNASSAWKEKDDNKIKYNIEYQPNTAKQWRIESDKKGNFVRKMARGIKKILNRVMPWKDWRGISFTNMDSKENYDEVWKTILSHHPKDDRAVAGAFVDWDNTPRKGKRGSVYIGASPQKFKFYFEKLVEKVKEEYTTDYIFIFAWNEWGEGGYLEPDKDNDYGYLEAIREIVEKEKML